MQQARLFSSSDWVIVRIFTQGPEFFKPEHFRRDFIMKQKNRRFVSSKPRFLISTVLLFCLAISSFAGNGNKIVPSSDPVKISEWDVVGPSGGDVRVVTIDPKDKNHLFVSTLDGSIHNSTDGGKT